MGVVGSFTHLIRLALDLFRIIIIFEEVLLQLTQLLVETVNLDSGFIGFELGIHCFAVDLLTHSHTIRF